MVRYPKQKIPEIISVQELPEQLLKPISADAIAKPSGMAGLLIWVGVAVVLIVGTGLLLKNAIVLKEPQDTPAASITAVETPLEINKRRLGLLYAQLDRYKADARIVPVSPTVKKNLDAVAINQGGQLLVNYRSLKDQISTLNMVDEAAFRPLMNDLMFRSYLNRLADMDFKKLLVSKNLADEYSVGMRKLKSTLVKMANDFALKNKISDDQVNVFITKVLLQSRYQALDNLLYQRYANITSLSGEAAEYARFRMQANQIELNLEN